MKIKRKKRIHVVSEDGQVKFYCQACASTFDPEEFEIRPITQDTPCPKCHSVGHLQMLLIQS